jgi:hypothetical protein
MKQIKLKSCLPDFYCLNTLSERLLYTLIEILTEDTIGFSAPLALDSKYPKTRISARELPSKRNERRSWLRKRGWRRRLRTSIVQVCVERMLLF